MGSFRSDLDAACDEKRARLDGGEMKGCLGSCLIEARKMYMRGRELWAGGEAGALERSFGRDDDVRSRKAHKTQRVERCTIN